MNFPAGLINSLHDVKGFDENAFATAHQRPSVISVRMHPVKKWGGFELNEKMPWCKEGRYLEERPVFTLDPAYHAGAYYVQEASSMFLDYLLRQINADRKGLRILDLCAAPGGKSTLLASCIDKSSLLISNEVIRSRVGMLEENLTRWGYMNTWVTSNDPRDFSKLPGYFNIIVVDAPCSGSGLFRKDERALKEWSEGNVQLCSQRQRRILADVWQSLKQDGILIYATCSFSPQEDEEIIDWLAEEFSTENIPVNVPEEWGIAETLSPVHKINGYRFFPDRVRGEGFFIAMLQKKDEGEIFRYPKIKPSNRQKNIAGAIQLLKEQDFCLIQTNNENYSAIHSTHETDLKLLQEALYLHKTGLVLGTPAAKEWLPAHDVALSIDASDNLPAIAVNKEQALRFLKKEDIGIEVSKGWYIVRYEGLGLGWVKSLGNRTNNYLPKHWRIRMSIPDAD